MVKSGRKGLILTKPKKNETQSGLGRRAGGIMGSWLAIYLYGFARQLDGAQSAGA